ncbi:hypothetical protein AB6A40_011083 [Gnathostoma spinigerum]|uniref:Uncharacterized protein n=1 Tax=Gnathostoma spinigerum TaxID=75299 RepID=A0ABD6EWN4_9BILA
MPLNASSQQSLHVEQQQQYSVNSSQNTEMPMNHNVITFQSHLEPNPLVQPTVDYSIPQNIDYMIGSYPSSTVSNSGVIDVRSSNQQELHYGQASASDGRVVVKVETPDAVQEVPTVSW